MPGQGRVRVDHNIASGTFSLDGRTYDVDNNIWVVGDDAECVVIDAPHKVDAVLAAVGDRSVKAIVCTHAHDDHVRQAPALRKRVGAPIMLHPNDRPLWNLVHGAGEAWDMDLADGLQIEVGGTTLTVLHTPGHSPGAVCLYAPDLGCVFTGDTLFHGGPGATGRSFSDRSTIEASIFRAAFHAPWRKLSSTPDTAATRRSRLSARGAPVRDSGVAGWQWRWSTQDGGAAPSKLDPMSQ